MFRIACLVPSITELLFDLGLGDQVVARSHYCIRPAGRVERVPSVGGTKKIKHRLLKELQPTHVILNIDENTRPMAEQLATYVPHLIVTHPLAPEDNLDLYRRIGNTFGREAEAEALCGRFEQKLTELQAAVGDRPRRQVLYLIWRDPWMTVARDTYMARSLALVRWDTWPETAEQRYPVVAITPELLATVDRVLFSSEPYRFRPEHLAEFARDYGCPPDKLQLIDGEMTSWYGSRAVQGLEYLRRSAAEDADQELQ